MCSAFNAAKKRSDPLDIHGPASQAAAQRLREIREAAGFRSTADGARAAGVKTTTYTHHENGRRMISPEVAVVYARAFRSTPEHILYGDPESRRPKVRIVGGVGGDGLVEFYPDAAREDPAMETDHNQGRLHNLLTALKFDESVEATVTIGSEEPRFTPAPAEWTHADAAQHSSLEITSDALAPAFLLNDELVYRLRPAKLARMRRNSHHRCVVRLKQGSHIARLVHIDGKGRPTIPAYNLLPRVSMLEVAAIFPVVYTYHSPADDALDG